MGQSLQLRVTAVVAACRTPVCKNPLCDQVLDLCSSQTCMAFSSLQECARSLGTLAKDVCPLREQVLTPPHLSKIVGQLKKFLQDGDSAVREIASESMALVAKGLAETGLIDSGVTASAHPVGKAVLDCLPDGKKELQAAACNVLGQVSIRGPCCTHVACSLRCKLLTQ